LPEIPFIRIPFEHYKKIRIKRKAQNFYLYLIAKYMPNKQNCNKYKKPKNNKLQAVTILVLKKSCYLLIKKQKDMTKS